MVPLAHHTHLMVTCDFAGEMGISAAASGGISRDAAEGRLRFARWELPRRRMNSTHPHHDQGTCVLPLPGAGPSKACQRSAAP